MPHRSFICLKVEQQRVRSTYQMQSCIQDTSEAATKFDVASPLGFPKAYS